MIDSLQLLPIDTLLLILNKLSIKEQLQLSSLNKFFYSLSSQSVFEKVIIVFSNYKPIDWNHYIYKFKDHTVIKSSPYNLELLETKISYIRKLIIFDNINGLITNWNRSSFHQLAYKSHIQHCFSVRSLSKINSNIKTLELNLINRGSISSSETVLKYSGLKFLRRIENLIILTNNFNRLYRFENILTLSLPQGEKLQLKSLVIKTYAGIGTDQENYYFVGSTDLTLNSFRMLNFNNIIDLGKLTRLELSIRQDKFENSSYWHYHLFKFIFSFFNDYNTIKSSPANINRVSSLFSKILTQDFDMYEEFQSWCHYHFHESKEYNLLFHKLTHLAISIYSSTDNTIPLNFIHSFVLKNKKISNLSLYCSSDYTRSDLFRMYKRSWFINFYKTVIPQLTFFDDRYFIQNYLSSNLDMSEYFQLKIRQIYKEVTGIHILNFNSIQVLSMLLDNYNHMNLSKQFVTSVSAFDTIVPLVHDESISNDYHYESYVIPLSPYKKRRIILKFVQLLKNILQREQVFDPNVLDESLQLYLNNIPFQVQDDELKCTL